jgi:hypothetical protein
LIDARAIVGQVEGGRESRSTISTLSSLAAAPNDLGGHRGLFRGKHRVADVAARPGYSGSAESLGSKNAA